MASLFDKVCKLPQAQFSELVKNRAKKEVYDYLRNQGADDYGLKELASDIVDADTIAEYNRIAAASRKHQVPSVFISDADKQSAIVNRSISNLEELDASGELEKMMARIQDRIDRRDNPEAYC
jgi:hypothetical protein